MISIIPSLMIPIIPTIPQPCPVHKNQANPSLSLGLFLDMFKGFHGNSRCPRIWSPVNCPGNCTSLLYPLSYRYLHQLSYYQSAIISMKSSWGFVAIFPGFLWFSHGFPMVFLWFSHGFPYGFPYGFPMGPHPGGVRTPLGGLGGDGDAAPGAKLPRTRHWGHGAGREAPDGRRSGGCFWGFEILLRLHELQWDWVGLGLLGLFLGF